MYSIIANKYFRNLNPELAQLLKRIIVYPRYYRLLRKGGKQAKKYGKDYKQKIYFVAGLPKSGTTWLENLLSSFPGITPIMPYKVTGHESKYKSSCEYDFPEKMFEPLKNGLFLLKMHSYGSKHNIKLLKEYGIRYCIVYRDLRDAAVSHYFYVRHTPWHPENRDYRNLNIKDGLMHFCNTRLDEWAEWIKSWKDNRDKETSVEITYEEMLSNSFGTFKRVVQLFELDDSDQTIQEMIEKNSFSRLKRQENSKHKETNFFRKGKAGDWKNHFDDEIKTLFKNRVGNLLIELEYEKDLDW